MNTVYVFTESSEFEDISNMAVFQTTNPGASILKNFNFQSGKSLVNFLEQNKENILNNIPSSEEDILVTLEIQNYLGYLDIKWYKIDEQENINSNEVLSPEELLALALKYKCVSEEDIMDYILEDKIGYTYELYKKPFYGDFTENS